MRDSRYSGAAPASATNLAEVIRQQTLDSAAASITFSGLSTDFRAFRLTMLGARCTTTAGGAASLYLYFNGDEAASNAHYNVARWGYDSSPLAQNAAAAGADQMEIGALPGSQTNANRVGNGEWLIDNSPQTVWREVTGQFTLPRSETDVVRGQSVSGTWEQTDRITSIKLKTNTGSFDAGTTFILEGYRIPLV